MSENEQVGTYGNETGNWHSGESRMAIGSYWKSKKGVAEIEAEKQSVK